MIGDAVAKGECVSSRVLVWCLLAPSRGGVLLLGAKPKARSLLGDPCLLYGPFLENSCERAPPRARALLPALVPNHPARWVRFLAPRPWV